MPLENDVLKFIGERGIVFYSDIARGLDISNYTVSDIIASLERSGKVIVQDKRIAKIVTLKRLIKTRKVKG